MLFYFPLGKFGEKFWSLFSNEQFIPLDQGNQIPKAVNGLVKRSDVK